MIISSIDRWRMIRPGCQSSTDWGWSSKKMRSNALIVRLTRSSRTEPRACNSRNGIQKAYSPKTRSGGFRGWAIGKEERLNCTRPMVEGRRFRKEWQPKLKSQVEQTEATVNVIIFLPREFKAVQEVDGFEEDSGARLLLDP
jgi:hypothetical protein